MSEQTKYIRSLFIPLPSPDTFLTKKEITGVDCFSGRKSGEGRGVCYTNRYALHKVWQSAHRKTKKILLTALRKALLKSSISQAQQGKTSTLQATLSSEISRC